MVCQLQWSYAVLGEECWQRAVPKAASLAWYGGHKLSQVGDSLVPAGTRWQYSVTAHAQAGGRWGRAGTRFRLWKLQVRQPNAEHHRVCPL